MALSRLGRARRRGDWYNSSLAIRPCSPPDVDRRDRRTHRRSAALRRGNNQGGARSRHRGDREIAAVLVPSTLAAVGAGDVAGLADGAPRPARARPQKGIAPDRRRARPRILPTNWSSFGRGTSLKKELQEAFHQPRRCRTGLLPRHRRRQAAYLFKQRWCRTLPTATLLRGRRQRIACPRSPPPWKGISPDLVEREPELLAHHFAEPPARPNVRSSNG